MSQALRAADAWGHALGELDPVPEERLALLLQTCASAHGQPGQQPTNAGELLQMALPLVAVMEGGPGKAHAAQVVPQVAALLERLPSVWRAPHHSVLQAQADCTRLMAALSSLVCAPGALPPAQQQRLSGALRGVLAALLKEALAQQLAGTGGAAPQRGAAAAGQDPAWAKSGANLLLRSLTREEPFVSSSRLPLLPDDAAAVLQAAQPLTPAPAAGGGAAGAAKGGAAARPAGPAQQQLLRDDKVYALLSKLVATAGPAAAGAAGGGEALSRLLAWSSSAVQRALQLLVPAHGADAGPAPPLEATYGAADLANTCVSHLLAAARPGGHGSGGGGAGGGDLPPEVLEQVEGVIDVALSVAEAALAAAADAPAEPDNDRVLGLASRILASVALVATPAGAAGSGGGAAAANVAARLHELLLEAARAVGRAPRGAPDAPPARSQSGGSRHAGSRTGGLRALLAHGSGGSGKPSLYAEESAAALAPAPQGGSVSELASPWVWDVTRPLTLLSDGTPLRHVPLSAGMGAQRLLRAAIEALAEVLAAAWAAGARSGVNELLLPRPHSAGCHEQMAEALTLARVYARLGADPALGALALPVLSDPLVGQWADGSGGGPRFPRAGASGRGPAPGLAPEAAAALVNALEGMACACARDGGGGGGGGGASDNAGGVGGAWAYDQALQLLLKLYREPNVVSRPLLSGPDAAPATRGLLARALNTLALGLSAAPHASRQGLRLQLMLLFSAVASRCAPGGGGCAADLGALLPAVAAAVEGLQPRTLQLLGGSSVRMSIHDIQAAQREDASTTRLFRNLWLHAALHALVDPSLPVDPANPASSFAGFGAEASGGLGLAFDPEWYGAAGRVAGVTPLLVVGTDSYLEADMVERLKVELGEQLALAGRLAERGNIANRLSSLVGPKVPPMPGEKVLQAFLLAVALAELCRAALAPLPNPGAESVVACPVAISLGYLKGFLPDGAASDWVAAVCRRAFSLYLRRLLALRAAQDAPADFGFSAAAAGPQGRARESVTGGSSSGFGNDDDEGPARALAYAEQLASALIAHLSDGGAPPAAGRKRRGAATAAAGLGPLADEMLGQLLGSFPALLHSRPVLQALLVQLQREEGDAGLDALAAASRGAVWERTREFVRAAADIAPATTEAMVHSFLGSGGLSPAGGEPGPRGALGPRSALGPRGAAAAAAAAERAASQAALRRAADLLRVCGEARAARAAAGASAGMDGGAYQGTLALSRKLHYSGFARGLISQALAKQGGGGGGAALTGSIGGASDEGDMLGDAERQAAAIKEVAAELHAALLRRGPAPASAGPPAGAPAGAEGDALLCATALLASQPLLALDEPLDLSSASFALGSADALPLTSGGAPGARGLRAEGLRLLRALCAAPLRRLAPEPTQLATFAWTWLSTESPALLVPLVCNLASAWVWTVDQRLGLFGGARHGHSRMRAPPAGRDEGGAADGGGGGGGTGGEEEEGEGEADVNDPEVLQAIAAHDTWLAYLSELWAVLRLRGGACGAAARQQYARLLHASLADPLVLSPHPASLGARFRLLALAAGFARDQVAAAGGGAPPTSVLLLFDQALKAALMWFACPPGYYAHPTRGEAREQLASLQAFSQLLSSFLKGAWPTFKPAPATAGAGPAAVHPVWGEGAPDVPGCVKLLQVLLDTEANSLRAWNEPLGDGAAAAGPPASAPWAELVPLAWRVDPRLALALKERFPSLDAIGRALQALVMRHAAEPRVQREPAAALLLATSASPARASLLPLLSAWAPGGAAQGLQLLCGPAAKEPAVRTYAIKCLLNEKPERVVFYLPQLVQLLRGDDGAVAGFFLSAAAHSDLFAHQLNWALASEGRPPEEAFDPEVKRSGWQPPKDTGLWEISARIKAQIEAGMTQEQREYWAAEGGYFDQVTSLSGYLYKFPKDERRLKLVEALKKFKPPRDDLYMPTNPDARILGHIPESGACMQSAAKVPILVAFNVERPLQQAAGAAVTVPPSPHHGGPKAATKLAAIFKVGDDIRQDVVAIQVISLLHGAFTRAGLGLYLRPYGCLPTGYECGIIECVPNTRSRAALGELSDRGLYDIFCAEFGAPGSAAFESARRNFIVSEAAYAIASFLLQAKDRHNGNIMLDDEGHIVHIDFGFILEISPGGNLGFESAAFKLSHEMTQLLDPGGSRSSPQFVLFEEAVVRAYLAARTVAEPIISTVALMADSGLPCFSRGQPVANLRARFHLEMSDAQAAAWMRSTISDAYDKWTTGFYDYIQSLQNKIPY